MNRSKKAHHYYLQSDEIEIAAKLPDLIRQINEVASKVLEPTLSQKNKILEVIKNYIRQNKRKVYGGTAIDAAIRIKNHKDSIYDQYTFADIEFYSSTPVADLVEIANLLYRAGYPYAGGREAQHEETYTIDVNFQSYCDITYVPKRVYSGIKSIEIDGILYAHPHFMLIDQFRIINQPLTAAEQRWEKTFKRISKLLKYYPFQYYSKPLGIPNTTKEITNYIKSIKDKFLKKSNDCLIVGFEAYNTYIHASQISVNDKMNYYSEVPYLELISINYSKNVTQMYHFLKKTVIDASKLSLEEYFPLFQFTGYSVFIMYNNQPIVRMYETDGFCVPNVKINNHNYVTYQYLLMFLMICKFRAHLDKEKSVYDDYNVAISNLIAARNHFLTTHKLSVINDTLFGDFKLSCIGSTSSYARVSKLRAFERYKQKKSPFRYNPEQFFSQSQEMIDKFDPHRNWGFKNTSGNKIFQPNQTLFKIENGELIKNVPSDNSMIEDQSTKTDPII